MDNKGVMASHSNLMLIEIIYGTSGKYDQDDVLNAELELSLRNVSDEELESLKSKVAYISGINMGRAPKSNSTKSSSEPKDDVEDNVEEDDTGEIVGHDDAFVKVLMVYLGLSALGSASSLIQGFSLHLLVGLVSLAIYVYGIYGLLNRLSQPIIFLVGIFTSTLVSHLIWMISFSPSRVVYSLVMVLLNGAILYFLTKPSMRSAYRLDDDLIKKAMIIGAVAAILLRFI